MGERGIRKRGMDEKESGRGVLVVVVAVVVSEAGTRIDWPARDSSLDGRRDGVMTGVYGVLLQYEPCTKYESKKVLHATGEPEDLRKRSVLSIHAESGWRGVGPEP